MKLIVTILLITLCIACVVSSTVREKRQWGGPYGYGGGWYGPRPFGPRPFGPPPPFNRGPTVIEKTVIYRG
ncbi:hypothetical protein DICVIV_12029 [Dictyocaulus viviparus]|uniref:Sulfur globule protein CV3 domain protein n=1 Tax=Dictyocaulus viviparus TaxID=29172 RepID=A0A0D8XEA8_DICVI|nr:hypothetical protein DICVIV_12029 [Dictyocaulus viviparus]